MLRAYGLSDDDWVFAGDGANDASVAAAETISIGINPHPALASGATWTVNGYAELPGLLGALCPKPISRA